MVLPVPKGVKKGNRIGRASPPQDPLDQQRHQENDGPSCHLAVHGSGPSRSPFQHTILPSPCASCAWPRSRRWPARSRPSSRRRATTWYRQAGVSMLRAGLEKWQEQVLQEHGVCLHAGRAAGGRGDDLGPRSRHGHGLWPAVLELEQHAHRVPLHRAHQPHGLGRMAAA